MVQKIKTIVDNSISCPECGSLNCEIGNDYKQIFDGVPKPATIKGEGLTLYHQDFSEKLIYCLDCDYDFYIKDDIKGIDDKLGIGINKKTKKETIKKEIYESSKDDKNYTIDQSLEKIYQNSKEFRIDQFKEYLERTSHEIFTLLFSDGSNAQQDYKHRWTKQYQKGIISKLYQFEAWAKRHKLDIGMITLTSAQTGYTDLEVLNRLKDAWAKLQDNLNKKKYLSFKLFEPHTKANPGYPHIHVLVIGKLWQRDIDSLIRLWKDKYNMGDGITDREGQDHSIKFDLSGNIESLKNYLMKYLDKTIVADILHDDLLLKFHSMFYDTGTHLYSASRYLYFVMKKLKFKSNVILTHLIIKNKEIYNKHESKAYPCKYQQIEGLRYKYKLAPFEIKPRWNYYYSIDILNNFNVQKIFKVWDNQLWDNKNLALLNL